MRRTSTYPVGPACPRVGLVDDDGHAMSAERATARGKVRRQCDVATEPDHQVGVHFGEHRPGLRTASRTRNGSRRDRPSVSGASGRE